MGNGDVRIEKRRVRASVQCANLEFGNVEAIVECGKIWEFGCPRFRNLGVQGFWEFGCPRFPRFQVSEVSAGAEGLRSEGTLGMPPRKKEGSQKMSNGTGGVLWYRRSVIAGSLERGRRIPAESLLVAREERSGMWRECGGNGKCGCPGKDVWESRRCRGCPGDVGIQEMEMGNVGVQEMP
jgi:hypothetical protein